MTAVKKHKIGIMGGTFDPIHIGHLMLAQSAYETLGLEKVLFIVSGNPPHKRKREGGASNDDRARMTELAISGDGRFVIDLMEVHSDEYSYTYRTLQKLTEANPENEYYFIVGEDSLIQFPTWREPELISKLCHIAVGYRHGCSTEAIEEIICKRNKEYNDAFVLIETPIIDISSSDIRKRIKEGLSSRYYLPESVYNYMEEKQLYRAEQE